MAMLYGFFRFEFYLVILWSIALAMNRVFNSYYQSILESKVVLISESLRCLVLCFLIVILILELTVSFSFVLVFLISSLLTPVLLVAYKRKLKINWNIDKKLYSKYFKYGIPMSVWLLLSTMYPAIERAILVLYQPEHLTDYLAISEVLIRGAGLVFTPIIMYLHPYLMRTFDHDVKEFDLLLFKSFLILAIFTIITLFIYSVVSRYLITWFFPGFDLVLINNSTFILLIPALWQFSFLAHKKLEAQGKTILMSMLIGVCLTIYATGLYFFIPVYGVWTSVVMQILSLIIYIILIFYFTRKN